MIGITDPVGIGILIAATAGSLVSIIGAVFAGVAMLRTGKVQKEVKTFNELTLGQLGERTESRRISEIEPAERTAQENRHQAMEIARDEKQE